MASREVTIQRIDTAIRRHRVTHGKGFRLGDHDPGDTGRMGREHKPEAQEKLARAVDWLAQQQDKLNAQDRRSLLLVFQAMDAASQDGTTEHVMSGVNPQGLMMVAAVVQALEEMDLAYPRVGKDKKHQIETARNLLAQER